MDVMYYLGCLYCFTMSWRILAGKIIVCSCRCLDLSLLRASVPFVAEERYLLIDAYNVICATDELRATLRENIDSARDQLTDMICSIHDAEGVRTALILDSRNETLAVDHPFGKKTFEFIYAPASLSADGVIERIVARVSYPAGVTVVSNDNMVRESIRANGAMAMTPEELFDWARACDTRLVQDAQRRRKANAREWKNGLDI
ncbi:MAG: putative RNA-binding protein with PIN domain [Lentimonas sp.]|jgi:predicted RNA-binding protein with PIN domain